MLAGPSPDLPVDEAVATIRALASQEAIDILTIFSPACVGRSQQPLPPSGSTRWFHAARESGLPIAIRVFDGPGVEAALSLGVDVLWVDSGTAARASRLTDVNAAMAGVELPVLVSNPFESSLDAWLEVLDKIHATGNVEIAALHTGIPRPDPRNAARNPGWSLLFDLRIEAPELQIISAPCFVARGLEEFRSVAQRALHLGVGGLMTRSRIIRPERRPSESGFTLTPQMLNEELARLNRSRPSSSDIRFLKRLTHLRSRIETLDRRILDSLAARMLLSEEIGRLKREAEVTLLQVDRWRSYLRRHLGDEREHELPVDFVERLLRLIHEESIRRQASVEDGEES